METALNASTSTATDFLPSSTDTPTNEVTVHNASPVVAFMIGLSIILLASILNAAGLNLTKLDHVRTKAIPKASRRRDLMRPLWLLGMLLYILSQLIGSTLALEYMRAEYVAPLGSTSLIFNFLFASVLVGTPVTSTDIYGTAVVILGVVGIVAFGSINSGLATETDVAHLTALWMRGGWLSFFLVMSLALGVLFVFVSQLDGILAARSDLSSIPFAGSGSRRQPPATGRIAWIKGTWNNIMVWVGERLEHWTAAKDDKQVAWTLGIGWACAGGGLAGGCLVFAKACVKLISGSLSHENTGNQLGHAAPILTMILLAVTAVLQIICLNRGLAVYDSTLVVPVFYGVYTATGFLDSLIFNNSVDAYQPWTLFLIFVSILILISGVVLLTHKKPDRPAAPTNVSLPPRRKGDKNGVLLKTPGEEGEEDEALRIREEGEGEEVVWDVGGASDDEEDSARDGGPTTSAAVNGIPEGSGKNAHRGEEGRGLMENLDVLEDPHSRLVRRSTSPEDFGDFETGKNGIS